MGDNRGQTTARLGGTHNAGAQNSPSRPEWWLRSWFINVVFGVIFGTIISVIMCEGMAPNLNHPEVLLYGAPIWVVAVVVTDHFILYKLIPGFKSSLFLQCVGGIVPLLIIMALMITPKCGWNNDQCKPVHRQTAPHR